MKKLVKSITIKSLVVLSVFSLTACSNNQTADKKIATTSAVTTTLPIVTTTKTENTVTTSGTVTAEPPVTTASTVTTSATTTTSTPEETTTTTKKAITTTKKVTTTTVTTKKNNVTTTTTTKKPSNNNDNSNNKNKTQTMWASEGTFVVDINNGYWDYADNLTLYKGDKVTAYPNDTVTITKNGKKVNYTKIKMIGNAGGTQTISIDGYVGYVETSCLSTKEIKVTKVTESDVKKLCAELQEYSNSLSVWKTRYTESIFYGKLFNDYDGYCKCSIEGATPLQQLVAYGAKLVCRFKHNI